MPQIMMSIDQIMAREKRDMLFIRFGRPFDPGKRSDPVRKRHFEWFASKGLRYETAAPRGLLEGDPGIFAVYFDGPDDPRIAEYSSIFEDANGKSFAPDEYQMLILSYKDWLQNPPAPEEEPL
jgi:hypothetical protein